MSPIVRGEGRCVWRTMVIPSIISERAREGSYLFNMHFNPYCLMCKYAWTDFLYPRSPPLDFPHQIGHINQHCRTNTWNSTAGTRLARAEERRPHPALLARLGRQWASSWPIVHRWHCHSTGSFVWLKLYKFVHICKEVWVSYKRIPFFLIRQFGAFHHWLTRSHGQSSGERASLASLVAKVQGAGLHQQ